MAKPLPIPAFSDNYLWTLIEDGRALVVDPGDAAPVIACLEAQNATLDTVLVTHHHADHVGGLLRLRERYPDVRVIGPANHRIKGLTERIGDGAQLSWQRWQFIVMAVPGHTLDHLAYFAAQDPDGDQPLLFCGDTLFSMGCGRLFEGTPAQMLASLDRLSALPANTRVCCTHEYTLSNLRFALALRPDQTELQHYQRDCEHQRAANLPTLPSSLANEKKLNPFLNAGTAALATVVAQRITGVDCADRLSVFTALRQLKDQF